MKTNKFIYGVFLSTIVLGWQGCASENPFESYGKGEGTISFQTEFYSDISHTTRGAIESETLAALENKLTVYVENSKGVIKKFNGKNEIPSSLTLAVGDYILDGWTGDSVSASFTDKFYRGKQSFTVTEGQNNTVTFKINIANVIVSVDASSLEDNYRDINVKVGHTRAELDFDNQKIQENAKGYFMMPVADKDLYYEINVTSADGDIITRSGLISDVQRAYEYNLRLSSAQSENNLGGAYLRVEIQKINVLDHEFEIFPAPLFKATYKGGDFDLADSQIVCNEEFNDFDFRVVAYGGLDNLSMTFDPQIDGTSTINGVNLETNSSAIKALEALNITYEPREETTVSTGGSKEEMKVYEVWLRFNSKFFENLSEDNPDEYKILIHAEDGRGNTNEVTLKIARSATAIENNLVGSLTAPDPNDSNNPFAILATSVELEGMVYSDEAENYGIEYREKDSNEDYTQVLASEGTRASGKSFKVTIKDLDPGTTYEYRAFCDGYHEKNSRTFTTEGKYEIPNWNMESWSTDTGSKKDGAILPSADGKVSFWDTGNHGSITMSKNLTSGKTDFMANNTVACLQSQFVGVGTLIGKFAAGNLFVGEFGSTVGMNGAKLDFGREYNGSHPSALKVKVNYRPGKVDYTSTDKATSELVKNENDFGQVYIALATAKSSLNTADGIMFNKDGDNIIAYGQVSWNSNIGGEGQLEEVTIPIKYYQKAKTEAPLYLIIVCSASKYGDYFAGSSSSTLYLDDFELEYGEIEFEN